MTNEENATKFLQYVNENYDYLKSHLLAYCKNSKKLQFDEDVFSDTYMKIYDKIMKDGIIDNSPKGFENYFFMAFRTNIRREKQYSRNAKRIDMGGNVPTSFHEEYQSSKLTEEEKLKQDLYKDFSTLYLFKKVEDNFPAEYLYLFKLKVFEKITYQELVKRTGIKNCRQKVAEVKQWLKDNVTKEEIDKEFNKIYGNLIFD